MHPITYGLVYGGIVTAIGMFAARLAGVKLEGWDYVILAGSGFAGGAISANFIGAEHWFLRILGAGFAGGVINAGTYAVTGRVMPKPETGAVVA